MASKGIDVQADFLLIINSLLSENEKLKDRIKELEDAAIIDMAFNPLKEQVKELREALSFAYTCCYHPNFTDRHGMMDKMKAALNNTAV